MAKFNLLRALLCTVFVLQGFATENSTNPINTRLTSTEHRPTAIEIQGNINFFPRENLTGSSKNSSTPVSAIAAETSLKIENEFKPSILFDEIIESHEYQTKNSGSSSSPFNNVQHVRFEGSVGLEGDRGPVTFPNPPPIIENTESQITGSRYEGYPFEESVNYGNGHLTGAIPSPPIKNIYYTPETSHYQVEPTMNAHYQKPMKYDFQPATNYHQHYEYVAPNYYNHHHEQNNHHVNPIHHQDSTKIVGGKPAELLYLTSHRETSLMKTRKFPYKFYQPDDDTGIHFVEEGHAFVPRPRHQISPWRKLIHLVGAFLPFGLLLAALNKPIIKIDRNTTQPSIMLSKWRGVDLPLEHKGMAGLEACEDMILCEAIVAGAEKNSDLIYSILWNFAVKSSDEEARKNGLEEIFTAVKKKNCKSITC